METLLFEVSVYDLLELAILQSKNSNFVCNFSLVVVFHVLQIGNRLREFQSDDLHTRIFRSGNSFANPEMSESRPGFEVKLSSFLFVGSCVSLHLFWLLHTSIKTFRCRLVISRPCSTKRTAEMDGQAVTRCNKRTRLHPFNYGGVTSATLPQLVAADPG